MNIPGFWYIIFCSHVGNGHNLDNVQVKTSLMDGEVILSNVSEAESRMVSHFLSHYHPEPQTERWLLLSYFIFIGEFLLPYIRIRSLYSFNNK